MPPAQNAPWQDLGYDPTFQAGTPVVNTGTGGQGVRMYGPFRPRRDGQQAGENPLLEALGGGPPGMAFGANALGNVVAQQAQMSPQARAIASLPQLSPAELQRQN